MIDQHRSQRCGYGVTNMVDFPGEREARFLKIKQTCEGRAAQLMCHGCADDLQNSCLRSDLSSVSISARSVDVSRWISAFVIASLFGKY